ncbi:acetylcholine receptor subunit alpha-1-A-like isoform X2 [Limulus polyphemus]|nr:acetylcholine receptor subunit alpha-1-A-like isoform X2 [Limulus polyphemus]
MEWKDEHFVWDPADYDGLSSIHLPDHTIWQPDITIYNSFPATDIDLKTKTLSIVNSAGVVTWVPPATIRVLCPLDLSLFPDDIQVCKIKIGSWTHDGLNIDLQLKDENMSDLQNHNMKWQMINITGTKVTQYYDCCPEPYHSIEYYVRLRRLPVLAVSELRHFPILVAILLFLVMFWVPVNSKEKLVLGAAAIFMLYGIFISLIQIVSSGAVRITVKPVESLLLIGVVALILEVIVLNLPHLSSSISPPRFLVSFLSGVGGRLICICGQENRDFSHDRIELTTSDNEDDNSGHQKPQPIDGDWYLIATGLDRILFVVFLSAFIIVFVTI